jgi:hypothetical protein
VRFTIRDTRGPCHRVTRSIQQKGAADYISSSNGTQARLRTATFESAMLVIVTSAFLCHGSSLHGFNNSACKITQDELLPIASSVLVPYQSHQTVSRRIHVSKNNAKSARSLYRVQNPMLTTANAA